MQYTFRVIKYNIEDSNETIAKSFQGLICKFGSCDCECLEGLRDARKMFRLLNSLVEYWRFLQILNAKDIFIKKILNGIAKLCYFFYWICDNIVILSKVKCL